VHEKRRERERLANRPGDCDYNSAAWRQFRAWFRSQLVRVGVTVACGASLPGSPVTTDSQCRTEGRIYGDGEHKLRTGRSLVCDHIEPHRGLVALFFNLLNLQLLCQECHNRKSQREKTTIP
jgi:hypothetical protein